MEARGARIWIFVGFVLGFAAIIAATWVMVATFTSEGIFVSVFISNRNNDKQFNSFQLNHPRHHKAVGQLLVCFCKTFSYFYRQSSTNSDDPKICGTERSREWLIQYVKSQRNIIFILNNHALTNLWANNYREMNGNQVVDWYSSGIFIFFLNKCVIFRWDLNLNTHKHTHTFRHTFYLKHFLWKPAKTHEYFAEKKRNVK